MKIIVDEIPSKPGECLFARWNCEYGWMCTFKSMRRDVVDYYCHVKDGCAYLEKKNEDTINPAV